MADQDRSDEHLPEGGIFGKLPDSRPGTRSPRRRSSSQTPKARGAKATKATAKKSATAGAKPRAAAAKPATAAEVEPGRAADGSAPDPEGGRGLESLAWAGVAVAAEAATAGVRLASKAIEALRGSQERR